MSGLVEGRRLDVTIDVFYAETGEFWFFQRGQFIQDSEPPEVISHSVHFDIANNLLIEVTAADAATSPIHADFWFSTDGGISWDHVSLDPASDILDEPSTQTFQGVVGPLSPAQPIQYFLSVQDVVFNTTYFGIGTVAP